MNFSWISVNIQIDNYNNKFLNCLMDWELKWTVSVVATQAAFKKLFPWKCLFWLPSPNPFFLAALLKWLFFCFVLLFAARPHITDLKVLRKALSFISLSFLPPFSQLYFLLCAEQQAEDPPVLRVRRLLINGARFVDTTGPHLRRTV